MSAFPHLLSPLALRDRMLNGRLGFGAHPADMAEGGRPGERHRSCYEGAGARRGGDDRGRADAGARHGGADPPSRIGRQEGLADRGLEAHAIGDCVAPRLAVMAIYDGPELAMRF